MCPEFTSTAVPFNNKLKECEQRMLETLTQQESEAIGAVEEDLILAAVLILPGSGVLLFLNADACDL